MVDKFSMKGSCRAGRLSDLAFASFISALVMLVAAPLHAASYNLSSSGSLIEHVARQRCPAACNSETRHPVTCRLFRNIKG